MQESYKNVPAALVLAASLSAAYSSCSTGKAARGPSAVPVVVASVLQKDMPVDVQAIGNVQAFSTVSVRAQVTGELKQVHFKEGDPVKKGALLFTLDTRPFDDAVRQAQADLERTKAAERQA